MSVHEAALLLHLLGAGVMVGIIFFSLTLSIRKPLEVEDVKRLNYIRSFGAFVMIVVFLTGLYLFLGRSEQLLGNGKFIAKMILVIVDGIIAERIIKTKMAEVLSTNTVDDGTRKSLPVWAWISTLVIFSVFTLGYILQHGV